MPDSNGSNGQITLVLGGARSGKSSFALSLAEQNQKRLVFVATAAAWDAEMRDRIARHQEDRSSDWTTIEEQQDIGSVIRAESGPGTTILVDCLTIWLSNLMHADKDIAQEIGRLAAALEASESRIILVSNEVGFGIVPENKLGRKFRDEAGRVNQRIAAQASDVALIVAGLPLWLKN